MEEGEQVDTEFRLNVKGTTMRFAGAVFPGTITASANGTASKCH